VTAQKEMQQKDVWKFSTTALGEQSVMTASLMSKQKLLAMDWASGRLMICTYMVMDKLKKMTPIWVPRKEIRFRISNFFGTTHDKCMVLSWIAKWAYNVYK